MESLGLSCEGLYRNRDIGGSKRNACPDQAYQVSKPPAASVGMTPTQDEPSLLSLLALNLDQDSEEIYATLVGESP